jgi:hypothetical protein
MDGAIPPTIISERQFPRTFAWIKRFKDAVAQAKASASKPVTLKGEEVAQYMQTARMVESAGEVDANDPTGFKAGDEVEIWPIETGFSHHDRGTLITLTPDEMVIAKKTKVGGKEIHVHAPRWGFRIARVREPEAKL